MSKNPVSLRGKNILGLEDFSPEEIQLVLDSAKGMKNVIHRDIKKLPTLRGKSIVTLFYEPSTRTRSSFELAGKYLGADVVNITAGTSSIVKGESLRDTLLTVEAMGVDAIVMRHKAEGAAAYATQVVSPVIINAGDGAHAHPSQGLLDLFTILQSPSSATFRTAAWRDPIYGACAKWGWRFIWPDRRHCCRAFSKKNRESSCMSV